MGPALSSVTIASLQPSRELMPLSGSMTIRDIEVRAFQGEGESTDSVVFIHKPAEMVRHIDNEISHLAPRRMVELGIYHGGSAIYWENRFALEQFAVFDIAASAPVLERYQQRHRLHQVCTHFGVSQADADALRRHVRHDFQGELIDVVSDDASHQYAETLASFECLFPMVRHGGAYVIEDWAWGHAASWDPEWWADRPLMSPLITELMLVAAYGDNIVDCVDVVGACAVVWRGPTKLEGGFRLKDHYRARGFALP